jgi:hypothetical protein
MLVPSGSKRKGGRDRKRWISWILRPRAGTPWSKEEDAALLADVDAGLPVEEIARRRQRGIHAVQVRLFKLGHGH